MNKQKVEEYVDKLPLEKLKRGKEFVVEDPEIKTWIIDYEIKKQEGQLVEERNKEILYYSNLIPFLIALVAVSISLITPLSTAPETLTIAAIIIFLMFLMVVSQLFARLLSTIANMELTAFKGGWYLLPISKHMKESWLVSINSTRPFAEDLHYTVTPESKRRYVYKSILKRKALMLELFAGMTDSVQKAKEELDKNGHTSANLILFPVGGLQTLNRSFFSRTIGLSYYLYDKNDDSLNVLEVHSQWRRESPLEALEKYKYSEEGIYSVELRKLAESNLIELVDAKPLFLLTEEQKKQIRELEEDMRGMSVSIDALGYLL